MGGFDAAFGYSVSKAMAKLIRRSDGLSERRSQRGESL